MTGNSAHLLNSEDFRSSGLETHDLNGHGLNASRIGLGTWAIGGWMWGGTDEAESIRTIQGAPDKGVNLIDTAPVYGFGRSEEIVGKAVAEAKSKGGVIPKEDAGDNFYQLLQEAKDILPDNTWWVQ